MATIKVDEANTVHSIQSCPAQYDPNFDYTQCINDCAAAAGAGGTVQFTRGNEYEVTGPVCTSGAGWVMSDDVTFEDTGSGAAPLLYTNTSFAGGLLHIRGDGVTVRNLHLQGPWPNQMAVSGRAWEQGHYGVHVYEKSWSPYVWCDTFTLQSTEINGFSANGLKLTGGSGHEILNNTIVYNYESAVAVFGDIATALKVNGNTLSYNGANGIDTGADYSEYCNNSIVENGWAHANFYAGGEGQGIILNPSNRETKDLLVDGNMILRNARSGIVFLADDTGSFNGVDIRNNNLHENGTSSPIDPQGWGVRFDGSLQNVDLEFNDATENFPGATTCPIAV